MKNVSFARLLVFITMLAAPVSFVTGEQTRVLLIPLDDRPPCLQWPVSLGPVGGTEVVAPPRDLLGRFMESGDSEGIADWVRTQDLETFDAVIASLDMLAYGGLVGSRVHQVGVDEALERVRLLAKVRDAAPDLPIYGFNIIMRLAPTADGRNDAWRGSLARWAELASQRETDPSAAEEVSRLEERIPEEVLADYKRARERNLSVNRAAIEMVETGTLDYLVLGQDDAKPEGLHVADHRTLLQEKEATDAANRIKLQPGADEVAMLLLARVLIDRSSGPAPSIRAIYSSEAGRKAVAQYEDRPLHQTVSLQIAAAGGRETEKDDADLLFYVFTSRHEEGMGAAFADRIADDVRNGRRVIVADVDMRGNVQGGSAELTEALRERDVLPHLFGYASWNTAGNTLGTALPQGILYHLATGDGMSLDAERAQQIHAAQFFFLLQRLINDYVYQARVRPEINSVYAREQGMNTMRLTKEETERMEQEILDRVAPRALEIWRDFRHPFEADSLAVERDFQPVGFSDLQLTLPWGRTFEAEIDFDISAEPTER